MKEKKKRLSKLAIQKHAVEDVGSLRYAMLKREFTGRRSKLLEFERCKNPIRGKLCSFCRQVGFNVPKILDEVDTAEMPHPTLVTPLP
jgi:hypothetical protein